MDIFERLGNLFSGKGFSSNSEASRSRDNSAARRAEEERRRREAEQQRRQMEARAEQLRRQQEQVSMQNESLRQSREQVQNFNQRKAAAEQAATVREQNPLVRQFNELDVDAQRQQVERLRTVAEQREFNTQEDIIRQSQARQSLGEIEERGVKKGGHLGTFGADLFGGFISPAKTIVDTVANTALAPEREDRLRELYMRGGVDKAEYNSGLSEVLDGTLGRQLTRDSDGRPVIGRDGFVTTKEVGGMEALGTGMAQGADAGLTYSPIGSGYANVARLGTGAARNEIAKGILKEGSAYFAGETANDLLQGREVTPGSLVQNAIFSFGGATLGGGMATANRAMRIASDKAHQARWNDLVLRQTQEAANNVPDAIEVVPGSGIKSTNLANQRRAQADDAVRQAAEAKAQADAEADAAAQQAATPEPAPAPAPAPTPTVIGTAGNIPDAPKMVSPLRAQAPAPATVKAKADNQQKLDDAADVPATVNPETPQTQPLETTTTTKSKQVKTPVVAPKEASTPPPNSSGVAKELTAAEGRVEAASERVAYLKREKAPAAQIKKAEAELSTARGEVKELKATPAAKTTAKTVATAAPVKTAPAKAAPVKTVKTVKASTPEPKATPVKATAKTTKTTPKTSEAPVKVVMNKNGTVSKPWVKKQIDEIMASDLPQKDKVAKIKKLTDRIKKAESKSAVQKQTQTDAGKPDMSKTTKRARERLAPLDKQLKSRKTVKTVSPTAETSPLKAKGKRDGGKVGLQMARVRNLHGDPRAEAALSSLPGKTKVSFKKDMAKSAKSAADDNIDTVIGRAKGMKADNIDYQTGTQALADNARLAEEVAKLAGKKRLKPAEKKRLEDLREAQADIIEQVSIRVADDARMQGYLSYLYKSLDPTIVANRVIKRITDPAVGGRVTAAQSRSLHKRAGELKRNYDEHDVIQTQLEDLQKGLSKDSSPEDIKRLAKLSKDFEASSIKLADSFHEVNVISEKIKLDNIDKGYITEKKWYGRKLDTYTRSAMLSAPSGRIRDLITTNIFARGDVGVADFLESVLSKAYNTVTGKRTVGSKMFGSREVTAKAYADTREAIGKSLRGETKRPMFLTGIAAGRQSNKASTGFDARSGLNVATVDGKKPSAALRWIHTTLATPTYLTKEYKYNKLYKAGYDEAIGRGLSKAQADALGKSYLTHAPKELYNKISFTTKEISGLQSKVGEWINKKFQGGEAWINKQEWNGVGKSVAANSLNVAKNLTIPFSSYMTGIAQNLVTRQSMTAQAIKFGKAVHKARTTKDPKYIEEAISAAAKGGWNAAKFAAVTATILPLMSDTDVDGNGYAPPYINIGDNFSVSLGIFGPFSGQLINAWAAKKAVDEVAAGGNVAEALGGYGWNLARGLLSVTGVGSVLGTTGSPVLGIVNNLSNPYQSPNDAGSKAMKAVADTVGDIATQQVPAVLRDINSLAEGLLGDWIKPETLIKDEDGKTDPWLSAVARIGSAVPGVSQSMPNDDKGKQVPNIAERTFGITPKSDATREEEAEEAAKVSSFNKSLSPVMGSDTFRSLLDKDTKELYDKASTEELDSGDLKKVRDAILKGEKKFLEDSDYDSYVKVQQLKLDKVNENPAAADSDRAKIEYDMKVGTALGKHDVEYDLYKMYAKSSSSDGSDSDGFNSGVSQSELNKMFDPESEYYNPELGNQLLELDETMASEGVSDNSLNSKRPKYSRAAISKSLGGGGGGGRGGPSTNVGTVGLPRAVGAPELKARALKGYDSPIPNLAAQTARTNLKKKITVQKGVKL